MNEFKKYHPVVNFTYFVFAIGFSCFIMHPVYLAISLVCGFAYSVMLKGKQAIKTNLVYMLPLMLTTALINPAFNHEGVTIITYLPGGNPLTLESVVYGLAAAAMIISVICHFSCYNEIMTSDKFIFLFGKIIPSMSLIISMTLRFVPRFTAQLKTITNARRCMGYDVFGGNILKRAKAGISILSATITLALENAVETADSMKARGYGHPGRTAFSIFVFDARDKKALVAILTAGLYIFIGNITGGIYFRYFPNIRTKSVCFYEISLIIAYFIFFMIPIIIELWEVGKWKSLKSKI